MNDMDANAKKIQSTMKAIRDRHGISLEEAESATRIKASYIYRIETNSGNACRLGSPSALRYAAYLYSFEAPDSRKRFFQTENYVAFYNYVHDTLGHHEGMSEWQAFVRRNRHKFDNVDDCSEAEFEAFIRMCRTHSRIKPSVDAIAEDLGVSRATAYGLINGKRLAPNSLVSIKFIYRYVIPYVVGNVIVSQDMLNTWGRELKRLMDIWG